MDGTRVASGAHRELQVWDWRAEGESISSEIKHELNQSACGIGPWHRCAEISEPSAESQEDQREVLVTSVHWTKKQLIVSYLNHGIQSVIPPVSMIPLTYYKQYN